MTENLIHIQYKFVPCEWMDGYGMCIQMRRRVNFCLHTINYLSFTCLITRWVCVCATILYDLFGM